MRQIVINIEQRTGDGADLVHFKINEYSMDNSTEIENFVSKIIMDTLDKKVTELLGASRVDIQDIEKFLK